MKLDVFTLTPQDLDLALQKKELFNLMKAFVEKPTKANQKRLRNGILGYTDIMPADSKLQITAVVKGQKQVKELEKLKFHGCSIKELTLFQDIVKDSRRRIKGEDIRFIPDLDFTTNTSNVTSYINVYKKLCALYAHVGVIGGIAHNKKAFLQIVVDSLVEKSTKGRFRFNTVFSDINLNNCLESLQTKIEIANDPYPEYTEHMYEEFCLQTSRTSPVFRNRIKQEINYVRFVYAFEYLREVIPNLVEQYSDEKIKDFIRLWVITQMDELDSSTIEANLAMQIGFIAGEKSKDRFSDAIYKRVRQSRKESTTNFTI